MADDPNALVDPVGTEIIEGSEPSPDLLEATTVEVTGEPEGDTDVTPKVKGGAEERIGTLTRKWREAEKEAAYYRGIAEGKPAPKEPETPVQDVPAATAKPQESDFEDYTSYVEALTDWKTNEKIVAFQREEAQKATDLRTQTNESEFDAKLTEGAERYEDFEEVARNPILPITPGIIEVLKDTEYPADIAYYLGKNIKECTMISRMPILQAARVVGRIEAEIKSKFVDGKPPGSPAKTRTVTEAPPPITTVKSAEVVTKDPSKMTQAEYEAWRKEGGGF